MKRITIAGGQILGHFKSGERVTDAELYQHGTEAGMGPAFFEGLAEGIRIREEFRAKHGRFPELGEC